VQLTVYVAADGHRSADELDVRFLSENTGSLLNNKLDLRLSDALEVFEVLDDSIYVVLL
jgi:hypothetical protein